MVKELKSSLTEVGIVHYSRLPVVIYFEPAVKKSMTEGCPFMINIAVCDDDAYILEKIDLYLEAKNEKQPWDMRLNVSLYTFFLQNI